MSFLDMDMDWSGLRRALESMRLGVFAGWKRDVANCNREDLRAVSEVISNSLVILYMWDEVEFKKEEEGWQALEQLIDTPDKKWQWSGPVSKPISAIGYAKMSVGVEREAIMQKLGLSEQDLELEGEEDEAEEGETGSETKTLDPS